MNRKRISGKKSFSFTWVIENFSYCWQKKDEEISSPAFTVETMEKTKWKLILYPKESVVDDVQEDFISFYLERQENSKGPANFTIFYEFSFVGADGSLLVSTELLKYSFQKDEMFGCENFVKRNEVLQIRKKDFLSEDALTIRCRIWNAVRHVTKDGQCLARTRIKVERTSFLWTIKEFSIFKESSCQIKSVSEDEPIMYLNLVKSWRGFINLEVLPKNAKLKFSTFHLYFLDPSGNRVECLRDESIFDDDGDSRLYTLSGINFFHDRNLYLTNDVLTLCCECAYATGIASEEIEMISYGCLPSIQEGNLSSNDLESEKRSLDLTRILQENLESLYKDNLFSDTKLKTTTGTFPAHKSILSARSPVFKAMFVNDMKEKSSECVYIEDLDDDTVRRMLLYMYTAVVEDLQWESASALYAAADKYEILSLKGKCASFLKYNLSLDNVCELLVLADMHLDQDLKLSIQDYILNHPDVFNSNKWKLLMKTNVQLAANVMYMKCKEKM
ncbi:TD and POZ domain-containing protein 5 [Nephila pilipes]|uniref:TD and POZ domain-containing protein 5 n=1 Tax=Nephila pilipes TaxID=299642 RepID=A0A8X6N9I4_NEPPI|nr:TD and POZ domain-containing protein 5 [Nephila pilipes]